MIDWDFIASLEGADRLRGYVPNPSGSRSGVTIASGIDLGQMTGAELAQLPADLQDRVLPYLGLTGFKAVATLKAQPLAVTPEQAQALDAVGRAATLAPIKHAFDAALGRGRFDALPDRAQTVIASVGFQYGSIPQRCPKFWRCTLAGNWAAAIRELQNFGDAYQTRHDKEAAYLAPLIRS